MRFGVDSVYDCVRRAGCCVLVNIVAARTGYAAVNREIVRFHEILREFRRFFETSRDLGLLPRQIWQVVVFLSI